MHLKKMRIIEYVRTDIEDIFAYYCIHNKKEYNISCFEERTAKQNRFFPFLFPFYFLFISFSFPFLFLFFSFSFPFHPPSACCGGGGGGESRAAHSQPDGRGTRVGRGEMREDENE